LPSKYVLDAAEITAVTARTTQINAIIAKTALRFKVPVVDMNAFFVGVAANGVATNAVANTATFASGTVGTFSISRVAHGLPNGLGFEIFAEQGSAAYDLNRPGEFSYADFSADGKTNGTRRVLLGPQHPHLTKGLPMDFPSVGHGQNEFFAWQARAFLDQVAGLGRLPKVPPLAHGLHNLEVLAAVTKSATTGGAAVQLDSQSATSSTTEVTR
jgi:predicted dehydrogenase